jgi:PAS domain S-box-containing protein
MIDLLETQRLKDAIEANPKNFQAIIEATDIAICITTEEGNFFAVNDNYCNLYGYEREELIGNSFLIVVPPPTKQELSDLHDKFIEAQVELFRTWEVQRKDGELIKISVDAGYTEAITGKPQKLTFVVKV